jgi:aldose 1-epimerase
LNSAVSAGDRRFRAQRFRRGTVEVVQLRDEAADLQVSIVPSHGNIAFELLHEGADWLWTPFENPIEEMGGGNALFGIPLLSPWANRLSSDTYSINGTEYTLNRRINNLRVDHNYLAIHGLVMFAPWTVTDVGADAFGAYLRSTLNFTRHSDWMAQFPFAHRLELTHRISDGKLCLILSVTNDSAEPMPLCIGFHPYFKLPGVANRRSWQVGCAARKRMLLSDRYIPTGQTEPFSPQDPLLLNDGATIDNVYTDLQRDGSDCATFFLNDGRNNLTVGFGPKFSVAVIYAPADKRFVCFEPMTAPTDALHLAPAGLYDGLQYLAPGETWTEYFWIRPEVRTGV